MENLKSAREEILAKLKATVKKAVPSRPEMPTLRELALNRDEMVARFIEEATAQTAVVHRAQDIPGTLAALSAIVQAAEVRTVMVSNDDVVAALDLPAWGNANGIKVLSPKDFSERKQFTGAVFEAAQAGITGADFAVAESGTIGLIHNKNQPRLISLAPIHHIAILPLERLVPVYENVTDVLFNHRESAPNHFTFITGPSMTGDIQAVPFKGMHGPRKLDLILTG
jgi:L-lactate dehydrogenase complex protein LldG